MAPLNSPVTHVSKCIVFPDHPSPLENYKLKSVSGHSSHPEKEQNRTAENKPTLSVMAPLNSPVTYFSKCTVFPDHPSSPENYKLTVSDLPMLSCQYIQKGVLFTRPPFPTETLLGLLKSGLSQALTHFPALAGRLRTDSCGVVRIDCNDSGVDFLHANAGKVTLRDVLSPVYVPDVVRDFFALDGAVSYDGHTKPLVAVQVTELADGIFIGCTVNHAVTDGTSFWNFFNTWAEICRGVKRISRAPDFSRIFVKDSQAVLKFPEGGPATSFVPANSPVLRERIFHFSREVILELKARANNNHHQIRRLKMDSPVAEILGKQSNDCWKFRQPKENGPARRALENGANWFRNAVSKPLEFEPSAQISVKSETVRNVISKPAEVVTPGKVSGFYDEISSFQSLCAYIWKSVTRARKLSLTTGTTFRMAINCRHRLNPPLPAMYFGNAIQSIPSEMTAGELVGADGFRQCAQLLHTKVVGHGDCTVRAGVEAWERNPKCFPLGNFDGASITMGSSPRFPMYDNDFGWGRPLAVRSGRSNKFDGKFSAFPGREGGGSVDVEVCLSPETMKELESDEEFMQFVTVV